MMAGAISHIAFTGGWSARTSPPYTVSSKCCQVESHSPFRFLAALIPPCAHTECERFTGTIENRSACPPSSAILITAERPASPPPITIIRGVAGIVIPGRCAPKPLELLGFAKNFDALPAGGSARLVGLAAYPLMSLRSQTARVSRKRARFRCDAGGRRGTQAGLAAAIISLSE